jgi:hypothetical protein
MSDQSNTVNINKMIAKRLKQELTKLASRPTASLTSLPSLSGSNWRFGRTRTAPSTPAPRRSRTFNKTQQQARTAVPSLGALQGALAGNSLIMERFTIQNQTARALLITWGFGRPQGAPGTATVARGFPGVSPRPASRLR